MKKTDEKRILITGATDGIGKIAAQRLADLNAEVLIHGRNSAKVNSVVEEIKSKSGNNKIKGFTADFSSIAEVRGLANELTAEYKELDILINNAGVGFSDKGKSIDGYELRFAVNYLAPFLLTNLLLPLLKNASPARIVNVSSAGQYPLDFDDLMSEKKFDGVNAYRRSKLALIMFTIDLAEQVKNHSITVNSLHPGTYLNTNMVRSADIKPWGEPESGADAEIYLALSDELDGVTGKYFNVKKEAEADHQAYDAAARKRLHETALKLTGLV